MQIKSSYATFYFLQLAIFALICHHFKDNRCRKVHDLDRDVLNRLRSIVAKPIERLHAISHVLAMAMFALLVTHSEMTTYELPSFFNLNILSLK